MHPKMVEYCRSNIREKFKPIFYTVKNIPEKVSKGVKSMESKFKLPPEYLICNIQPFLDSFRPNLYFEYLLSYVFKIFVITWRVMLCPKISVENNVMW
jgi:hypothetical protein